ncbi:uncharacterized protein LOC119738238 isoform X2 [Patiria miniata]|nr:uncharacterized protein LOC119738238 isoform X2 [Patiria miniata]
MENMRSWFQTIIDGLMVKERLAMAVNFAKERPVAATLIGVAVATSFLPAVAFVSFVVAMLIIGVVALLVVEGTAILMGGGLLLFALFGSMIATVVVGVSILTGLIAGRFTWRITAPLRAKMAERLGMCKGSANVMNSPGTPKEKGQFETDDILDFTSNARKVETD